MTIDGYALRVHAAEVSRERLTRTRGRLRGLSARERRAVEETADAIGQAVASCLLDSAATDETIAAALASLYPVGDGAGRG
jgi:hypothetical protein